MHLLRLPPAHVRRRPRLPALPAVYEAIICEGYLPGRVATSVMLSACAEFGDLPSGLRIFQDAARCGELPDHEGHHALMLMYGKAGQVTRA